MPGFTGGEDEWQQRVAGWLPSGLAVWVGQRVLSVPEYVELWLRDSGATEHLEERYRQWLRHLRSQQARGWGSASWPCAVPQRPSGRPVRR